MFLIVHLKTNGRQIHNRELSKQTKPKADLIRYLTTDPESDLDPLRVAIREHELGIKEHRKPRVPGVETRREKNETKALRLRVETKALVKRLKVQRAVGQ